MYNLDGSRGAMCGNGIRCVGKYSYDHGIVDKTEIDVETASGIKHLSMKLKDGKVGLVTVDMGRPEQTSEIGEPITVAGKDYRRVHGKSPRGGIYGWNQGYGDRKDRPVL